MEGNAMKNMVITACVCVLLLGVGCQKVTSPDETVDTGKIVFAADPDNNGNYQIYTISANGSSLTRITNNTADDRAPSWSHDKTKIVFQSYRDGNWEIYIMDANGANQTRLTTDAGTDEGPSFSPDGSTILFLSNRTGSPEMYTMSTTGGSLVRLLEDYPVYSSVYAPSGTHILFSSNKNDSRYEIYTYTFATIPVITRITNSVNNKYNASYAPNATKIVYQYQQNDDAEVYVMNSDGSSNFQLTDTAFFSGVPCYSADSSKIAFLTTRDGTAEIYVMTAGGAGQSALTTNMRVDFLNWK